MRVILLLLTTALYAVATQHCQLEAALGVELLVCQAPASPHPIESNHCDDEACFNVETCQFASHPEEDYLYSAFDDLCSAIVLPTVIDIVSPGWRVEMACTPSWLASSWKFLHRAVTPIRAPSILH